MVGIKELSLFTGAGGGLLGTMLLGWEPIGYVENNKYCQRAIAARIKDGYLPEAPIFCDIQTFNRDGYAESYQGMVDVITAGFPCQPFSVAGQRKGAADERNMWPATLRCIQIVRPKYVFLENVRGLLSAKSYSCVCGWPDRWRGMYRDLFKPSRKALLSRNSGGHVRQGRSIIDSDKKGVWRNNPPTKAGDGEMEYCCEMAYWRGRGATVLAEDIPISNAEKRTSGDITGIGGYLEILGKAQGRGYEVDSCFQNEGSKNKGKDDGIEQEGTECQACGRRILRTTENAIWYIQTILGDLAESGYDTRWRVLSAAEVGAPHKRDRLWVVANRPSKRCRRRGQTTGREARDKLERGGGHRGQDVADSECNGREQNSEVFCSRKPIVAPCGQDVADAQGNAKRAGLRKGKAGEKRRGRPCDCNWWNPEPPLGRVAPRCPDRVGQLRALGNGQVPLVVATVWRLLNDG